MCGDGDKAKVLTSQPNAVDQGDDGAKPATSSTTTTSSTTVTTPGDGRFDDDGDSKVESE